MSNQWFRIWHGFSSDPKWRTIARISKQPIHLVISVYVTLLESASQNVTRGHANVTLEDVASQLDVTEDEVVEIFNAMQGRVLNGFEVTGWSKRQPKREDQGDEETGSKSAVTRKREQREREKLAKENGGEVASHAVSRNVTLDTDTDTEKNNKTFVELFEFWKVTLGHEKAILDDKRAKKIKSAIALGYSVEDLKAAIVGCSKTPHNMGQNDRGEKYDDIELIFRSAAHIDRFIRNSKNDQAPMHQAANVGQMREDPASRYKVYGATA